MEALKPQLKLSGKSPVITSCRPLGPGQAEDREGQGGEPGSELQDGAKSKPGQCHLPGHRGALELETGFCHLPLLSLQLFFFLTKPFILRELQIHIYLLNLLYRKISDLQKNYRNGTVTPIYPSPAFTNSHLMEFTVFNLLSMTIEIHRDTNTEIWTYSIP